MQPILSKCGYRCDLCLAYRPNVEAHPENKQLLSDGWHTYFGFRIQPESIYCDGCLSEDGKRIDKKCPVRPCVITRGIEHCACCTEFICEKLQTRLVNFDAIQAQFSSPIPRLDRERFIAPFENDRRLQSLRFSK